VTLPSGEQIELTLGEQRAVVVEVGGGLRTYSAGGRDVLRGYGVEEMCSGGRGQVLVPWTNRIEDGAYELDGQRLQLALTEPAQRNAIHGLVRWAVWSVADREPSRVVMEHLLHPQPGYPFVLALSVEYVLSEQGLRVTTTGTNVGARPCPYGCGAHPYLTVGTETVDTTVLRSPAATVLRSDERGIPRDSAPVEGTEFEFRSGRSISPVRLDHAFSDLERGEDGLACVELSDPQGERGLTLWLDESYRYLMLFTGDSLPDVARCSLAVEPMTCAPNAFRSGDGLVRLESGEKFAASWGISPA